ncbi:MAG: putative prokaryotic signal transducing protein [Planctomycetota bacterium]|jgi:hypothetical protein
MDDPKAMVELAGFADEASADMVVARLAAEGIPAACLGGHIKNTNLFFALCLPIKVVVRSGDLARARQILAQDSPSDGSDEGWEDEAEQTPSEDE